MRDDPRTTGKLVTSDRTGPLALQILAASHVEDLKADARELSKLYAELSAGERERLVVLLFDADL